MKHLGDSYENFASQWLLDRGLRLLERNFRCKVGEIDLIALDGDQLVFVEVRARSNPRFASAVATVDRRKQRKLRLAALHYLQKTRGTTRVHCRFDVIAIEPRQFPDEPAVRWIRSAF
ncbi:YraN family protein [Halioglobus maricola]|uniref:UPF0102 protein EY643_04545 n=1 Tax=Halioglobus maricola TaxID=2601894 RepID=A0A5P9NGN6_9GAMM|nr:YraN family protein [Halioglobus maricola]QFU74970.1 YraN family protein [Halioglobus maricola]